MVHVGGHASHSHPASLLFAPRCLIVSLGETSPIPHIFVEASQKTIRRSMKCWLFPWYPHDIGGLQLVMGRYPINGWFFVREHPSING